MRGHLICPLPVLGADVVPGDPSPRTPRECGPSASWFLDQRLWLHRPGVWPRLLFLEQNQRPQGFPVWAPRGPAAVYKECGGCSSALKQLSPPSPPPGDRDPRRPGGHVHSVQPTPRLRPPPGRARSPFSLGEARVRQAEGRQPGPVVHVGIVGGCAASAEVRGETETPRTAPEPDRFLVWTRDLAPRTAPGLFIRGPRGRGHAAAGQTGGDAKELPLSPAGVLLSSASRTPLFRAGRLLASIAEAAPLQGSGQCSRDPSRLFWEKNASAFQESSWEVPHVSSTCPSER